MFLDTFFLNHKKVASRLAWKEQAANKALKLINNDPECSREVHSFIHLSQFLFLFFTWLFSDNQQIRFECRRKKKKLLQKDPIEFLFTSVISRKYNLTCFIIFLLLLRPFFSFEASKARPCGTFSLKAYKACNWTVGATAQHVERQNVDITNFSNLTYPSPIYPNQT
jgi:hypothetical protein